MDNSCNISNEVKKIGYYNNTQKLLLVGEGDFSFSSCLANAFGSASNMVATSLLSREELMLRHKNSEENVECLETLGCLVLHGVDVHSMSSHEQLNTLTFDVIIFNFPHSGHCDFFRETSTFMIERHSELMKGYFKRSKMMLRKGGQVHVTHRDDYPYNRWELVTLGEEAGFTLVEKSEFNDFQYPTYEYKRGSLDQT